MDWNKDTIFEKVIEVADKYGPRNPQQIKQFNTILRKCDKTEVFEGLYRVFLFDDSPKKFERQQLAGVLLFKTKPRVHVDLAERISLLLETWDVSVEEVPWYFAELCGVEKVNIAIGKVRNYTLSKNERTALDTIEWWLSKYDRS